jgi:Arc/MetJ-type ribon-helix-helix transcriptional regulator
MPTITIRVTNPQKATLEARAQQAGHRTVSDYVRETLELREERESLDWAHGRIAGCERRLDALERIAGIDGR